MQAQPEKFNPNLKSLVPWPRKIAAAIWMVALWGAMFWAAGSWSWWQGWVLWGVLMLAFVFAYHFLRRTNPEVIWARARRHPGTKWWDLVILSVYSIVFLIMAIVGPLDTMRWHILPLADYWVGFGVPLIVLGFSLTTWAESVNRFFEPTVRIQIERGHCVISHGPYAIVRHPGYVGAIWMMFGIALTLCSGIATILAGVTAAIFVLRTHLEDKSLKDELAGYNDYAQRVRYRLIPGVW